MTTFWQKWLLRGHTSSPSNVSSSSTPVDALFVRRQDTPGRTQDDSVVYNESKGKEGSTRRPKRRGASFSLRSNTSRTSSWTAPPGDTDQSAPYGSTSAVQSGSRSSSVAEGNVPGDYGSQSVTRTMYSTKSTPSLQYYTSDGMEPATPPGVVPNSQSWHSSISHYGSTGDTGASHMKKSYSQSWVTNSVPQPYRNPADTNKENVPARGQSDTDVRHGHSASFSGPSGSWQRAQSSSHISSRNYENVDSYRVMDSDKDKSVDASSYQRSASPPMPPTRDVSSLRYIKVSQSHEKYPSWPVTQATVTTVTSSANHSSMRAINSRTNSWSDTTHTSSEFPNKPRMAYQPQLNTHPEERMSPQTMRRYFEENRIRSPKDEFDERVATELRGVDVDIKKDFPLDAKGKLDISNMKGSDPSYPLPQLDKDGRYREDKNYAIPSPPQRDGSPVRYPYTRREPSPPPPSDNSGTPENSSQDRSVKPGSGAGYPYIIRQRAFYNTSTQTESKNVEIQADMDQQNSAVQPQAKIRREEKSVQARPGSIVSHQRPPQQQQQQQQPPHKKDNDYERLLFNRESVGVGTSTEKPTTPTPQPIPEEKRVVDGAESSHTNFTENVFAQIKEHSQDDTVMLRRLSQEYFRGQPQYGANIHNPTHQRLLNSEVKPRRSLDSQQHSRQSSLSSEFTSRNRHLSSDGRGPSEKEDKIAELPKMPNREQNQYFDRTKSANMSLRKAYGIFDEIEGAGKASKKVFPQHSKAASMSEVESKESTPPKKSGKSKRSKKSPETRESKTIAEKARKEWEKSTRSKSQDQGRLKRTTSEQLRPMKERIHEPREVHKYSHPPKTSDNRRKSSDPASVHVVHRHTVSDDVSKVEDFLCNSPLSRQRRMGSESDSLLKSPSAVPAQGASSRPAPQNQPPSTPTGEHSRNSDPELKKFQQQALLNFFEKKTHAEPTSRRAQYSPSGENLAEPKRKSASLPRDAVPQYSADKPRKSSHEEDSLPSPPLLDTTKEMSPAKSKGSSFIFQSEYSPPPHPWKETEKNRSWSLGSSHSQEGSIVSPGHAKTERVDRSRSRSEEETHPKALEANTSSSSSPAAGQAPVETSNQKYTYKITVNQNYSPKDEDDKPPVLPPRNYRGGSARTKGRPSLEQPKSPVPNGEMNNNKHVSQVNVRFTSSEYDSTPKVDTYADQLRAQSRRISQSQSSLLSAARYQNKPVPEAKTTICSSRPVDKPPTPQEAKVPLPGTYGKADIEPAPKVQETRGPGMGYKAGEADPLSKPQETRVPIHNYSKSVEEFTSETISKDGSRTLVYSKSTDELPKERNPLDNIRATSGPGPISPRSPANNSPHILHSTSNSFDKSPRYESSPKESGKTWDQKNARPHHLILSAENTPPPPPPPKNISPPEHRLEDKPLPPPPPLEISETNGDTTPTSARYSSESYLYNRGTTRQGFGGNYHRSSGELSPAKPQGSPGGANYESSISDNGFASGEFHSHRTREEDSMAAEQGVRQINKPYMEPPWGKRTFYPANNKHSPPSPSTSQSESNSTITGSVEDEQERVESPSVKACIANFESWSPRSQRKFGQSQVGRTKVLGLRETFVRKSNENLSETGISDACGMSSRSRSNESLEERLSATKSTENLNKTTVVSPGRDRVLVKSPTVSETTSLVLNLDPKPTSPTLESGYNSHTPDNRSLISEMSSSGSNPSRNGSTVSKDSIDIPTSQSVTVVHVRQKSMEEIECEKQAAIVVSQLPDTEKQKVSEVMLPPPEHKTSTDYMCGLFDTHVNHSRKPSHGNKGSPSNQSITTATTKSSEETLPQLDLDLPPSSAYWSPPSIAQLQNRMRQEGMKTEDLLLEGKGASLQSQKVELVSRIEKKLSILQDERRGLMDEIDENNDVGRQVSLLVEQKASSCHEFNKFKIYLDELDTVLKLLLKVSGQLARAENAVMSLSSEADAKEKRALIAKRDDLSQKHEDAKQLKEGIDLRSHQVAAQLKKCLTPDEFNDYEYFIKMKSKLKMELQEIDDKISLGEEQLSALRRLL